METMPAKTKPNTTKPVETKPVEAKPVETQPADTKPVETKPVEAKPVETRPVETKPDDTVEPTLKNAEEGEVTPAVLRMLIDLGHDKQAAQNALLTCDNDFNKALELLESAKEDAKPEGDKEEDGKDLTRPDPKV